MKINKDKVKERTSLLATERTGKIWRSGVDNIEIKWVKEKSEREGGYQKKTWRANDIGIGTTPHGYNT